MPVRVAATGRETKLTYPRPTRRGSILSHQLICGHDAAAYAPALKLERAGARVVDLRAKPENGARTQRTPFDAERQPAGDALLKIRQLLGG